MFNSYLQLELRRKNIWHAGHHKTVANFKSVAYVHNQCCSKFSTSHLSTYVHLLLSLLHLGLYGLLSSAYELHKSLRSQTRSVRQCINFSTRILVTTKFERINKWHLCLNSPNIFKIFMQTGIYIPKHSGPFWEKFWKTMLSQLDRSCTKLSNRIT